jgi:suppressor of fused
VQDGPSVYDAPGWDAITEALARVYREQEPRWFGTAEEETDDPLDAVAVYEADDHWHYVGLGLSDLYGDGDDGWGFELTIRVRRDPGEPPAWPVQLLQDLARYVERSGHPFDGGHKMGLNRPLSGESGLRSLLFVEDPELPPADRVRFLQVVGITDDERLAASAWDANAFAALAAERDPRLVTDLARASWLDDPAFSAAWERGRRADGSSTTREFVPHLAWRIEGEIPVVTIDAVSANPIALALPGRTPFGRPYELASPTARVMFVPGSSVVASPDGGDLVIEVPDVVAQAASSLRSVRGSYPLAGITFEVVPTELRDARGAVVRVIG